MPSHGADCVQDCRRSLLRVDKKAERGAIRYVLLRRLGEAFVAPVADDVVGSVLERGMLAIA